MKTISGTVISSKPISVSKATKVLSTFVSAENGASQAIGAYLRRTLASFKELKQLHKELKTDRSENKRKRRRSGIADNGETNTGEKTTLIVDSTQEVHQESLEPKRKKTPEIVVEILSFLLFSTSSPEDPLRKEDKSFIIKTEEAS